jgi:[glutamine synthetase] adenylyltransferase / [glutamine synthetase]-adenylyl-L-tyrosine phosphorylase
VLFSLTQRACYAAFAGHSAVSQTISPSELRQFEASLASINFRDRQRALSNSAEIARRVPPGVMQSLAPLLAESPDPDTALNTFERLAQSASGELLRVLDRQRHLIHYALAVFGYSPWLGETLLQNLDLFHALSRDKNLGISHSREDYAEAFARFRSRSLETDTALLLARFKRREYVRIMLRDVLRIGTLADTTAEISALSDVLIEQALRDADMTLRNRYGAPQHLDAAGRLMDTPFAVLSLGKLGGNELNYSSDIDLMFVHGDGAESPSASISNHEYFIRLAQLVSEILSRMTVEGAAFRIDLRLRPQGGEGDPAVGLTHALEYYSRRASDWELQALIKVRHSAGDTALARDFIRRVQPFVYTQHVNFAAIDTALASREKMLARRRLPVSGGGLDVKTDRGGIRDIEFLVQCLQRVYGGTELWLRSGGTMFSLAKLHDKAHISSKEFHQLTTAYEFLRTVEHRLQLRRGQQTHRLPAAAVDVEILERSVETTLAQRLPDGGIERAIRERMAEVAEIYTRIIHHQQWQHDQKTSADEFRLISGGAQFGHEQEQRQMLSRLAEDCPELYDMLRRPDLDAHARRNLQRFLAAAFTSAERYATVVGNMPAIRRAQKIFTLSDYLTDLVVRYPEEIAVLAPAAGASGDGSSGKLFPAREQIADSPDPVFEYLARGGLSYEDKLASLRRHYRTEAFRIGAWDILEPRSVYKSLREFSRLSDKTIRAAFAIADAPPELAVIALGRLGSQEADLLSDADLIFVRDENLDSALATRKAEQIVEILSAYTREGTVLSVDTRLRPSGAEGDLVVTPAYLQAYFQRHAQAWEALTYTKLRHLAGSVETAQQSHVAVRSALQRFASDPQFLEAVRDVRARLEKLESEGRNLKTGSGGLYDLDYIIGYLFVRDGIAERRGDMRGSIQLLHNLGLLSAADAAIMDQSAELLRTVEHSIRLVLGKARKTLPASGPSRRAVEELVAASVPQESGHRDLEAVMQRTFLSVREVYCRILA